MKATVVVFNSSAMNSIENELAQIGSELLVCFNHTKQGQNVTQALEFIDHALQQSSGLEAMLNFRNDVYGNAFNSVNENLENGEWTKSREYWAWLADPICTIALHLALLEKEKKKDLLTSQEHMILVQLENLINSVLFLFNAVLGKRTNSVLPYMPAFAAPSGHSGNRGYPSSFTAHEIDYCNIMYWVVLPSLGARVYRVKESDREDGDFTYVPIVQNPKLSRLDNVLNVSNDDIPTVARLNGDCFFSKARPVDYDDMTPVFEPTAGFMESTEVGFHPTSVVTCMWAIRIRKLIGINNYLAKFLMGIHYSTFPSLAAPGDNNSDTW